MKDTESRHGFGASRLATALVIAVGLLGAGSPAGRGVIQTQLQERSVTVKGVAEVEAKADLATPPCASR